MIDNRASANGMLLFITTIVIVTFLWVMFDPIVTELGATNIVNCDTTECTTALGYTQDFWDNFLVLTALVASLGAIVTAIRRSRSPLR